MTKAPARALGLRGRDLVWGARTYVMAIVNATPDSFSGDGTGSDVESAIRRGLDAEAQGADIVDVGGESTRPGAQSVSAADEIDRVVPVIAGLRRRCDVPISVDTSKAEVARAALDAGADMVNDVTALRADIELVKLVAARRIPVVLMHNTSDRDRVRVLPGVGSHYVGGSGGDVVGLVRRGLESAVSAARAAGVADELMIVDPGIGFGKTLEENLELMNRLGELRAMGLPLLVGPSRKSFIGLTLGLPPSEREEGTAAAVAIAIARGADLVRVHDVRAMTRVARMTDAVVRRWPVAAGGPEGRSALR